MAATGSQNAAAIALATGQPVITIGGFMGGDPAPTAKQIAALARSGQLRYVLLGGQDGGPPVARQSSASSVSAWVTSHGTVVHYGTATTSSGAGQTLYRIGGA